MKFLFALIHNNESERQDYLKPRLNLILDSDRDFQLIEYSDQELIELNWLKLLIRSLVYSQTRYQYEKYMNCSHAFQAGYGELRTHFRPLLKFRNYSRYRRFTSIEMAVTKKHIKVFQRFLESDCDFMIVLENDAVIPNPEKLRVEIKEIGGLFEGNESIFITLGGGLSEIKLHATNLPKERKRNFIKFDRAFTNTAVAYMVPRLLVSRLLAQFDDSNFMKKSLPIDWLLNGLFVYLRNNGEQIFNLSLEEDCILHGSRVGTFQSWQLG